MRVIGPRFKNWRRRHPVCVADMTAIGPPFRRSSKRRPNCGKALMVIVQHSKHLVLRSLKYCEYFDDSVRVLSETLGVELSAKKLNVNPDRRFAAPTAEELASRDSSMGWTSNDTTRAGRALSAFIQVAALQACCVPRQVTRSAAASNIRPDAGVSWAERLLTDCNYGCGDRGYRNSYREGHPRPKARRLNSAGFLRALNIPSVEPPHHPPRSRFGPRADQLSNAFTSASSSLP
jgi:hypothetical protein